MSRVQVLSKWEFGEDEQPPRLTDRMPEDWGEDNMDADFWGVDPTDHLVLALQTFRESFADGELDGNVRVIVCCSEWNHLHDAHNVAPSTVFGRENVLYLASDIIACRTLQAYSYPAIVGSLLDVVLDKPADLLIGFDPPALSSQDTGRMANALDKNLRPGALALVNNMTGWARTLMEIRMDFVAALVPSYKDPDAIWAPPEAIHHTAWHSADEVGRNLLRYPEEVLRKHDPLWFTFEADVNWGNHEVESPEIAHQQGTYYDGLFLFHKPEPPAKPS